MREQAGGHPQSRHQPLRTIVADHMHMLLNFLVMTAAIIIVTAANAVPVSAGTEKNDSIPGPPPGTYKILSEDGSIRVPFELWRGDVRMVCRLNGHKVRMMIDNGFLWDQILLFGSPTIDSLGLDYTGEIDIGGSAESGSIASKIAEGIVLTYDDVEFYDQTAIVMPYSSGSSSMWHGTEGQISATFLKHFAVRFDFDEMVMTLTVPEDFVPTENDVEIPISHNSNNSWLIPATIELLDGRRIEMGLMMDLGYGDWLQLDENGIHGITIPAGAIPASLGQTLQGKPRGYMGRLKSIEIGGFVINDLLTAFRSQDDKVRHFHESLLGLALLSKFNFTYDYQNRRMFIEPSINFNTPSEYNMSGLKTRRVAGEYLEVITVLPGSPAKEMGIRTGDRVLTINDREAASYDGWELKLLLSQEDNRVRLVIERDGEEREVVIVLRRLV